MGDVRTAEDCLTSFLWYNATWATLRAPRRKPHGASRSPAWFQANPLFHPGFVGIRSYGSTTAVRMIKGANLPPHNVGDTFFIFTPQALFSNASYTYRHDVGGFSPAERALLCPPPPKLPRSSAHEKRSTRIPPVGLPWVSAKYDVEQYPPSERVHSQM